MKKRKVIQDYDRRTSPNAKSYQEICDIMGLPSPSSARYIYYKGLKKILPAILEAMGKKDLTPEQEENFLKSDFLKDIIIEAFNKMDEEKQENA